MAEESQELVDVEVTLYLAEARWRRDDQDRHHAALNQRLSTLFALNFAVLAILGASLSFADLNLPAYVEGFAHATIFMLLVNIVLLMWAHRVDPLSRRPGLQALSKIEDDHSLPIAQRWYGREIELALETNERRLGHKRRLIGSAMLTSSLTVLMVAAVSALTLHFG